MLVFTEKGFVELEEGQPFQIELLREGEVTDRVRYALRYKAQSDDDWRSLGILDLQTAALPPGCRSGSVFW